jgi:hypothetical protein
MVLAPRARLRDTARDGHRAAGKGLTAGDIDALRAGANTLAQADARLEHARALCDEGAALRRANRRADARAPLREALDIAYGCGAGALSSAPAPSCFPPARGPAASCSAAWRA